MAAQSFQRQWQKYSAITQINLQNQLAYVWDALGRSLFVVVILFIMVQLWTVVYGGRAAAPIAGLSFQATIWYFLLAEMIELGKFRHDMHISQEVKDGSIAYTLIRPYNYLAYHFFNGLGDTVVKMGLIFLLGAPIVIWYGGLLPVSLLAATAVGLTVALALLLDFCMASMIGLLAFVTEDTFSFRLIYQKMIFILGGLLIPLDFLPDWLQRIASWLPFSYVTYAPARLLVSFDMALFGRLLLGQLFWIGVMSLLLWRQYRWATDRLTINGG